MLDPVALNSDERQLLLQCVGTLINYVANRVERPIQSVAGVSPATVTNFITVLRDLNKFLLDTDPQKNTQLRVPKAHGDVSIDNSKINVYLPYLKLAVIQHRKELAPYIQTKANQILDSQLRTDVERPLTMLSKLMQQAWFKSTATSRLPRATDFLTVKQAEQQISVPGLPQRVYDEKFGILISANLFRHDLEHFRAACEMRDCPLSIAYIDIDDFKVFNTKYGEPAVDRDILPQFMSALEAHFVFRGHVYRIGGDEYITLLPNMSKDDAASLFSTFQLKLRKLNYTGIGDGESKPTVSVGICELNAASILTEFEIEERAARAKQYAKQQGKNCIASFKSGSDYTDHDLEIIKLQNSERRQALGL